MLRKNLVFLTLLIFGTCDKISFPRRVDHSKNDNTIYYGRNAPVRWYGLSREFKTIEGAEIAFPGARKMIRQYIENQSHLTGDIRDAVAKSMFGFSHRVDSFIELSIDTSDKYRIKHECMLKRKTTTGFSTIYQKEYVIYKESDLITIVGRFFEDDSETFLKYFDKLAFETSPL